MLPAEPALGPRAAAGPGPHTERAPRYPSEGTVPMRQALLGTPRASFSPSGYAPLLPLKIEGSCFYFSSLGSSKRVALFSLGLSAFRMNTGQQAQEKREKSSGVTPTGPLCVPTCHVPDLPVPAPTRPRLCCLNNLWASGPPLGSRLNSRANICSVSAQSLRAFFLFFFFPPLFKDEPHSSAVPLVLVQRGTGFSPDPHAGDPGSGAPQNEMAPMPSHLALFLRSARL